MCAYTLMYNFKSLSHSSWSRCLFVHTFQPFYYLLPNIETTSSNVGKELRFLWRSKPSIWWLSFDAKLTTFHSKWPQVWLTLISFSLSFLVTYSFFKLSHLTTRGFLFTELGALKAIFTSKTLHNQNQNLKYKKTLHNKCKCAQKLNVSKFNP